MSEGEPGKAGGAPSPSSGGGRPAGPSQSARQKKRLRWGIVALAAVVALIAWLATRGGDDNESEAEPPPKGLAAQIVDEAELEDIAAAAEHPIYWAGPMDGKELELSENNEGNVQVRYLKEGAEPGAEPKRAITIGSYPVSDAAKNLDRYAKRKGAIVLKGPEGRKLVSSVRLPTSVYFVSPDNSVQIEVYVPANPPRGLERAIRLAQSDKVQPVG